jgi:hypothetical protein
MEAVRLYFEGRYLMASNNWITLENGVRYNPKTGETSIPGEDGKDAYSLKKIGETKNSGKITDLYETMYGGKTYKGKYDPSVLDQITETDYNKAYEDELGVQEGLKSSLLNNSRGIDEAGLSDAYQAMIFNRAYGAAQGRSTEPSFLDSLKKQNPFQENAIDSTDKRNGFAAGTPEIDNILNNPSIPDGNKKIMLEALTNKPLTEGARSYLHKSLGQVAGKINQPVPAAPTAPEGPRQDLGGLTLEEYGKKRDEWLQAGNSGDFKATLGATQQPSTPSTPSTPSSPSLPSAPQANGGLDWKKTYDDLTGLITDYRNSLSKPAGKPKQQIGSFQQYGPSASIQRPTGYKSSTQFSTKGS